MFLTNSNLASLCVPAEGGVAGDRLLRGQRDAYRVQWPGGGIEFHPSHGDWVQHLRGAGFVIEAMHEIYAPAGRPRPPLLRDRVPGVGEPVAGRGAVGGGPPLAGVPEIPRPMLDPAGRVEP